MVVLAISGGGTHAAALGYGVLEELRRTEVTVNGTKRRLLDEVDVISAVSGGTLPAAYYALRGEKTFDEFEPKVLSRNFERELAERIVLNPRKWFRLASGTFGKSDIFAEIYDQTVFDHATRIAPSRNRWRPGSALCFLRVPIVRICSSAQRSAETLTNIAQLPVATSLIGFPSVARRLLVS